MAVLSKYTFGKLTEIIEPISQKEVTKEFFCQNIFNNEFLFHIFNKGDLKRFYVTAFMLKNDLNIAVLKYVEEEKDDYRWVFQQGGKLRYHIYSDCEGLNANFEDFQIPFDYKSLHNGVVLVKRYREWFKYHKFREKFSKDNSVINSIVLEYNNSFAPSNNLQSITKDDILHIGLKSKKAKKHSLIEDEFNYNQFEKELNELILYRIDLCASKDYIKNRLSKFDYLFNKSNEVIHSYLQDIVDPIFFHNYGYDNLKFFLEQHHKLRIRCCELIMTYIKWRYNLPAKEFNIISLEDFNLRCCILCKNRTASISQV